METVHRRLSNTQAVCVSHRWHRRDDVYQAISRVITGGPVALAWNMLLNKMYPCAAVASVNRSSCDVVCPPPETHHPSGRADDDVGEALGRDDGPRGDAPSGPDGLRGGACGARICGLTTGGGHPLLPSPSVLL